MRRVLTCSEPRAAGGAARASHGFHRRDVAEDGCAPWFRPLVSGRDVHRRFVRARCARGEGALPARRRRDGAGVPRRRRNAGAASGHAGGRVRVRAGADGELGVAARPDGRERRADDGPELGRGELGGARPGGASARAVCGHPRLLARLRHGAGVPRARAARHVLVRGHVLRVPHRNTPGRAVECQECKSFWEHTRAGLDGHG